MNANPKHLSQAFLAATAQVDDAAIKPLPNSRKVYVGPLRVPMREVSQADTPNMLGVSDWLTWRIGTRSGPTWILRELGSGCTAASSTCALAARNFGLAFICVSLRRHYPHQVRRVSLTRATARDPQR